MYSRRLVYLVAASLFPVLPLRAEPTTAPANPTPEAIAMRLAESRQRLANAYRGEVRYHRFLEEAQLLQQHQERSSTAAYQVKGTDSHLVISIVGGDARIERPQSSKLDQQDATLRDLTLASIYVPNPATILSGYDQFPPTAQQLPGGELSLSVDLSDEQGGVKHVESHLDASNRLILHSITQDGKTLLLVRFIYANAEASDLPTQIQTLWRNQSSDQLVALVDSCS